MRMKYGGLPSGGLLFVCIQRKNDAGYRTAAGERGVISKGKDDAGYRSTAGESGVIGKGKNDAE